METTLKKLVIFLCLTLLSNGINGQCFNKVLHTSGSEMVNGVNVTVSSEGLVDTIISFCRRTTSPYFIGVNTAVSSVDSGNGQYNFEFDPPVDSLTLNFSGISYEAGSQEIVILEVNGIHYPIPEVGRDNACGPLADLTPNGNITGCDNCGLSGWSGTSITGPINSLSVRDSVVSGSPRGALFSLFICYEESTNVLENSFTNIEMYPNPVRNTLYLTGDNLNKLDYIITDLFGRQFYVETAVRDHSKEFDMSQLENGVYFLSIESSGRIRTYKIIVQ